MNTAKTTVALDPSLLPDYQSWQRAQSGEFTLWNYIDVRTDLQVAAAFGKLFWPDFIEHDGYVLLAEQFDPASVAQWRQELGDDRAAVERMVNHVHVYDLFNNNPADTDKTALAAYLGQVLAQCWHHALHAAFPDKRFTVEYTSEPDDYGPTISFAQTE